MIIDYIGMSLICSGCDCQCKRRLHDKTCNLQRLIYHKNANLRSSYKNNAEKR